MRLKESPTRRYQELFEAAKKGRMPYERDAWLNLAFYLGEQYTEWNADPKVESIQRIARDPLMKNAPRPVVNKIMHYVRQAHHEALQDQPTGDVLPPTDDYQDISDALVAKAWIESQADENVCNFESQLSRAALWAVICGTGWLKWTWNARKKRLDIIPTSFFEVYLDPYARKFEDARYLIHSQYMDVEQVYEMFGKEVSPQKVQETDSARTELLRGMGAAPVLRGVTVNELWHKPCRRYPQGLYVVWCGDEFLSEPDLSSGLPYPHLRQDNMLPFTILGCIERPDSAYYISPVQFLRPPQMELNKYHAQRITYRDKFANGKWWVPKELQLENMPDDSLSQILVGEGTTGLKPELIVPTTWMPNDDGDMLEQQMMHLVGQHEVSQAQVPGRVEAAKAIELLKDSDAGALATLRSTISAANSQGWYQGIELARAFAPEEQMVLAYSQEGAPEVKRFRAGDMKPGFRIRTTMATGLARSRAARQDLLLRLWDSKAISDPDQLLELMEVPVSTMLEYRAGDKRLARNENLLIAEGTAVAPNSWDDHGIHLREHNRYRKTHEFRALSEEAKQKFEYHCDQHEKLQVVQVTKQAQLQMIASGQPPTAEPQSPPAAGGEAAPADQPSGAEGEPA